MKTGEIVRVVQGKSKWTACIGHYAIVIRLIPTAEISRTQGFPCGKWFEVFVNGELKQMRHDYLEPL